MSLSVSEAVRAHTGQACDGKKKAHLGPGLARTPTRTPFEPRNLRRLPLKNLVTS
jgi:hypothetical protein